MVGRLNHNKRIHKISFTKSKSKLVIFFAAIFLGGKSHSNLEREKFDLEGDCDAVSFSIWAPPLFLFCFFLCLQSITAIPPLSAISTLRELYVINAAITEIRDVNLLVRTPLEVVDFTNLGLIAPPVDIFSSLGSLKTVVLDGNAEAL